MFRCALSLAVAALLLAAGAAARQEQAHERSLRVGGTTMQIVAGRGSLWVLTCDSGCTGEARRSKGRIVRVDPRSAHVVESTIVRRPEAFAVGAGGVYAIDFWRGTIRRPDLDTLRVVASLKLRLPFRFSARDNGFAPEAVEVGRSAVWVASGRGALDP